MGNELVTSDDSPLSYEQVFYQFLPYYLSIGMDNDDYWYKDCTLTESYRKADELRRKRRNEELWLQGLYVYEAICDVAPILQAFAKKGTRATPYSAEPYAITEKDIAEKKKRDELIKYEQKKAKITAWAARINTQIVNRERKEVESE